MKSKDKDLLEAIKGDNTFQDLVLYRFILDSLPIAVITVDSGLKITSFNPWAEGVTGYTANEAIGRYCGAILHGGMCEIHCPMKTIIDRENPVVRLETTILDRQGEPIPVRMNTAALLDDGGKLIGGVEAFQDISHIKALEREKNNFISMIAHDIKSSIMTIGGFSLRLLSKGSSIDEEKKKKYLNIVKNESSKLELLIDDFLEFSRLQTGRLKLNFGPTSLDKELMELVDAYQIRASQSGIDLDLQNEEELPIIDADAHQLRRIFSNLLDNAFKFSKAKQKVTIITQDMGHEIAVKFIDHGSGINPSDLPHIFDPFHRGQMGEKIAGFGLGLATVKALVEAHGGRVILESEVGKGSTFTVIFPKIRRQKQQPYSQQ